MGADQTPKAGGKLRLRTLADLDGRTRAAQRTQATLDAMLAELDGAEGLSELERMDVESAALDLALLRDLQARYWRGEPIDPAALTNG